MKAKKNLVVLSGAGMSAESGLKTFRDNGGLWENHNIYEVATPEAWSKNPELVNSFYNERRNQLKSVKPNKGHIILAELEDYFNVTVITQNVDDLHERANSSNVIHLHGELTKVRCTKNPNYIRHIGYKSLSNNDLSPDNAPLRPHIVWFGEAVPLIEKAAEIVATGDIICIIGTSMQVYPAAGLYQFANPMASVYCINPDENIQLEKVTHIPMRAVDGMVRFKDHIISEILDT